MARPAGQLERMAMWSRRNPAAAAWLAAVPLLIFLGQDTGFLAGCLAAAMTIPLVRDPRPSALRGSVRGLFGPGPGLSQHQMGLGALGLGQCRVEPGGVGDPGDRARRVRLAGWNRLGVLPMFSDANARKWLSWPSRSSPWACCCVRSLTLMVRLDLSLLWVRRLASSGLIERTEMISASPAGAIVGLGIGLLEGHHLRKTAPVASRAESELLVVWGMAGVVLGLIMFEILFIGFYAFNPNPFFGRLTHFTYPTFLLLRFYYLCLGGHLGLSVMLLVVKRNRLDLR